MTERYFCKGRPDSVPDFVKAVGELHVVVVNENSRVTLVGRSGNAKFEFCVDCYWHVRASDKLRSGPHFELEIEAVNDAALESIHNLAEQITEVVQESSRISVATRSKYAEGVRRWVYDKPVGEADRSHVPHHQLEAPTPNPRLLARRNERLGCQSS